MSIKLHSFGIWSRLTHLAKRCSIAHVAVAYFGGEGTKRLPLPKGSLLVVDFSERAVRGGLTDPKEVLKQIRRGVEVHSVANLHAKVFVFDDRAVVGSTNVSRSSPVGLVEAAIETNHHSTVASARKFVLSLRGDHIGPKIAEQMIKIWQPPKGGAAPGKTVSKTPKQSKIWAVPLFWDGWDADDEAEAKDERPKARSELKSKSAFILDEFAFTGGKIYNGLKKNHRVLPVECDSETDRYAVVPCRVLRVRRFKRGRTMRCIVFLERLKNAKRINVERLVERLGSLVTKIENLDRQPVVLSNPQTIYALGQLWPSTH